MAPVLHVFLLLFSAGLWTFSSSETRQFYLVKNAKTWTEAQRYCRENFTDLATIRNQEEMNTVLAILSGTTNHFWIGLKPLWAADNTTKWVWSDGSTSSYRYWNSNEPMASTTDCVELRSENALKWNIVHCEIIHPFVCYKSIPLVLIKQNMAWRDALKYCRENHFDLVSVHTEEEQRWVERVSVNASTAEVWVGLRYTCVQAFWFWVSGSSICYQNWAPGNGTGLEDCRGGARSGAMQAGSKQWISLPETQKHNFICTTV